MMSESTMVNVILNNDQKQATSKLGKVKVKMMKWLPFGAKGKRIQAENEVEFKPTFRDLNPLPSMALILKQPTNLLILTSSGERCSFLRSNPFTNLPANVSLEFLCSIYHRLHSVNYSW